MASFLQSIVTQRCPRCRQGRLFLSPNPFHLKEMQTMPKECPVCKQDFVIEPGFYFGATYISYALNVAWLIPTFLFIRFVLGEPFRTFVITMFILLPVLVPILFRLSRAIWIHLFVRYDPGLAAQAREARQESSDPSDS